MTSGITIGNSGIASDVTKATPAHATPHPTVANATQAGSVPVRSKAHPNPAVATSPRIRFRSA